MSKTATTTATAAATTDITLPPNLARLVERHAEVAAQLRALTREKEHIDHTVRGFLTEHDKRRGRVRRGNKLVIVVELQDRGRMAIDTPKLRLEEPEIAARYERLITWTEVRYPTSKTNKEGQQ